MRSGGIGGLARLLHARASRCPAWLTVPMPKIKVEQLQEGMVVTAEVKNMDNMLLLPVGCTLTEKHISKLLAWGIAEVNVEHAGAAAEPADPLAKLPPEVLARLTEQVKQQFWELDLNQSVQAAIFNLALRRRARKGTHG